MCILLFYLCTFWFLVTLLLLVVLQLNFTFVDYRYSLFVVDILGLLLLVGHCLTDRFHDLLRYDPRTVWLGTLFGRTFYLLFCCCCWLVICPFLRLLYFGPLVVGHLVVTVFIICCYSYVGRTVLQANLLLLRTDHTPHTDIVDFICWTY